MSKSEHSIHVIETDGSTKNVSLYTDISDVTSVYVNFLYEDQQLYASTSTYLEDGYATELKFLDDSGITRYLCTETPTQSTAIGSLVIDGDLDCNIKIDGSISVSGTISGDVVASKDITYGNLTGSAKDNTIVKDYDFSIESGSITFGSELTNKGDSLYTAGQVITSEDSSIDIGGSLIIDVNTDCGLYNEGSLTISGSVDSTGDIYGCYNDSEIIITGDATFTSLDNESDGIYNSGKVTIAEGSSVTCNAGGMAEGTTSTDCNGFSNYGGELVIDGELTTTGYLRGIYNRGGVVTISETGVVYAYSDTDWAVDNCSSGMFTLDGKLTCVTGSSELENGTGSQGFRNYSSSTFICNGTAWCTGETYGLYNHDDPCLITVTGTIYAYSDAGEPIYNTATIDGGGKIYANDVLYYNNGFV